MINSRHARPALVRISLLSETYAETTLPNPASRSRYNPLKAISRESSCRLASTLLREQEHSDWSGDNRYRGKSPALRLRSHSQKKFARVGARRIFQDGGDIDGHDRRGHGKPLDRCALGGADDRMVIEHHDSQGIFPGNDLIENLPGRRWNTCDILLRKPLQKHFRLFQGSKIFMSMAAGIITPS